MNLLKIIKVLGVSTPIFFCGGSLDRIQIEENQYQLPVLVGKRDNPIIRIKISDIKEGQKLTSIIINTAGTSNLRDIKTVRLYYYGKDSLPGNMEATKAKLFSSTSAIKKEMELEGDLPLITGDNYFWLSYELNEHVKLFDQVDAKAMTLKIDGKNIAFNQSENDIKQRVGIALRKHGMDGINTSRIPGLATTNKGTLIAIFDARYDSGRDLQGNIDIGIHRSDDGGNTWKPIQIAIDMGKWGGLPEKFNGVSDPCILVDKNTNAIYIAGLWMHGVINAEGKWLESLNNESTDWNHQWKTKGSQPGFGVKETSQFMIVKSTDDGKTWSEPLNITKMGKKEEWWLWAPAPGQGITLKDGTLVFPTQGRDKNDRAFSNIAYSKDGGNTWKSSNYSGKESGTETMVVELSDGSIMLNGRTGANKDKTGEGNGRVVAVTRDLGETWTTHPTSRKALIEPVCMASIVRHDYIFNGKKKSVLLFSNPDSKTTRHRMTIKYSLDDGMTWSGSSSLKLDEFSSRGYSCMTSIDSETIGIFYESSQADIAFQAIKLKDLLPDL
ncbi:MAG TPA: sialidase family protein [Pedobacter sp.]|uniref:sialidase family protein n=1 Tax=Pedobacter sp. TaxID=1411316 RepID=UPI002C1EB4D4|nr:sialidase family protein [Pedobacter sp.]HMI04576.1 sialidase family protein [Pedobacter sp.]